MNFSSVRYIYLNTSLRVLGYHEPSDDFGATLSPQDRPPAATNGQVLEWLKALPSQEGLVNLKARQERTRGRSRVDETLWLFCCHAGDLQIGALGTLNQLARGLASLDDEQLTRPFVHYGYLVEAAKAMREAHATWEFSIDDEAFFKKHAHPRTVRQEYLSYLLRVVHVLSALTFPDEYQDSYVADLGEWLGRDDWGQQLILDSEETYELSRKKARRGQAGVLAAPDRYPARFMLLGQTVLRPFLMHNPGGYGQRLVPNARCRRKGA